jgi:hypothetical protein
MLKSTILKFKIKSVIWLE